MATFPPVETKDSTVVAAFIAEKFARLHPGHDPHWLATLFREVENFFGGGHPDYGAVDLFYHDFEHTLQATVCLVLLLEGRHEAGAAPVLTARQFELAVAAALLHDSGYLKLRSDVSGTGAKYTACHVLRSCAFAAAYLPGIGVDDLELDVVLGAISCTGPARDITHVTFREPAGRVLGNALATADYLGQMGAPDYPDKLERLFHEFREADEFLHVPPARRMFQSAADLIERTPAFWEKFVRRKLEVECQSMFRFLGRPDPTGSNAYLDSVERNIAEIRRRTAAPLIAGK